VQILNPTPDWVRAGVLAIAMLVFQRIDTALV
jgi:hypothetical protein